VNNNDLNYNLALFQHQNITQTKKIKLNILLPLAYLQKNILLTPN